MAYLDTRVQRYNQFQIILNRPQSRQCGNAFVLQMTNNPATIRPTLRFLGAGEYGTAFAVEHADLALLNIRTVIKLADRDDYENIDEIDFGYIATRLVENGITPHLPLYTTCKRPNHGDNPFETQNCICEPDVGPAVGCNFQRTAINPLGNVMVDIPAWFLPNPPHTHRKRVNHDQRKINNCLVSFAERLDGSFQSFMQDGIDAAALAGPVNNGHNDTIMAQAVLILLSQTIIGLKAMRETPNHGSWAHCDLHGANILYKQGINPHHPLQRQFIHYVGFGQDIYLRHNNRLFVLWDFGKVKQIRRHGHGFLGVPLYYDYNFLNGVFHLSGPGAVFAVPITNAETDKWIASYHYDIARLLAGIYNDLPNTMNGTKLLCQVLYKHFILLVNGGNTATNRNVDPITLITSIYNILTAHLNVNPGDAIVINYALAEWANLFNIAAGVVQVPPANQILKRYPNVPPPAPVFHFGKAKKSSKKSVRKAKKSSKKSVRKAKKSPKKSVRKAKKSPKKSVRKAKKSPTKK